jgi:hypothetical protein
LDRAVRDSDFGLESLGNEEGCVGFGTHETPDPGLLALDILGEVHPDPFPHAARPVGDRLEGTVESWRADLEGVGVLEFIVGIEKGREMVGSLAAVIEGDATGLVHVDPNHFPATGAEEFDVNHFKPAGFGDLPTEGLETVFPSQAKPLFHARPLADKQLVVAES